MTGQFFAKLTDIKFCGKGSFAVLEFPRDG